MIVNPFINLSFRNNEGSIKAITVSAPVKGDSLKVTKVDRDHDPELFGFLIIYIHAGAKGAHIVNNLTESERDRLTTIGFLVRNDQVSSPVYFSCDFYDVHSDLLPLRAQQRSRSSAGHDDLIVNPSFHRLANNEITPQMRKLKIASPFPADRSWFSIDDVLSAPVFYSYAAEAIETVDLLSVGKPAPKQLSPEIRQNLIETG